jgi:hypothetical protein
MTEASLLRIGDRVTLEGSEEVFLVVGMNPESQTASLLPTAKGKTRERVPLEAVKFFRGLEV